MQNAIGLLDNIRREKAEQYRTLELLRLDAMTLSLKAKIDSGDTKAIVVAVKIMEELVDSARVERFTFEGKALLKLPIPKTR